MKNMEHVRLKNLKTLKEKKICILQGHVFVTCIGDLYYSINLVMHTVGIFDRIIVYFVLKPLKTFVIRHRTCLFQNKFSATHKIRETRQMSPVIRSEDTYHFVSPSVYHRLTVNNVAPDIRKKSLLPCPISASVASFIVPEIHFQIV